MAKMFTLTTKNGTLSIAVKSGTAPVAKDGFLTLTAANGEARQFPFADVLGWEETATPRGADRLKDAVDAARLARNAALKDLHGVAQIAETLVPEDIAAYLEAAANLRAAEKELAAYDAKMKAAAIKREAEKLNPAPVAPKAEKADKPAKKAKK